MKTILHIQTRPNDTLADQLATAQAALGRDRSPELDFPHHRPEGMPPVPDVEREMNAEPPPPPFPTFLRHFRLKFAVGGTPYSGAEQAHVGVWIRPRDPEPLDYPLATALLDVPPPALLVKPTTLRPMSSVTIAYHYLSPLPAPDLTEIPAGLILVLDQVTDPHNFGAIVRSAAAFDVKAIVTTARHSPEATGVLAKSASGGLEHVPIVLVQNLARAMGEMKDAGIQLVGLAEEGGVDLADATLRSPLALVVGAEGKGLRQLTRETCDLLARVDLPGAIKSLNVSNATAIALHIVSRALR